MTLPAAENVPFTKETAPELIRRIAEEEEGRLELLVVGPMTNIAIALSMYPELKEKIRHIWFMGGAALGGNMTPTAEFNIWVDPVAAKLVIASGIPMTMVGLDVTLKAALNREDEQEIRSFGNKGSCPGRRYPGLYDKKICRRGRGCPYARRSGCGCGRMPPVPGLP